MKRDNTPTNTTQHNSPPQAPKPSLPLLTIDTDAYAHFLNGSDLNDEEKRQFIEAVWGIVTQVLSMGFGVHPVQHVPEGCGQHAEKPSQPPDEAGFVLDCLPYSPDTFIEETAERDASAAEEGFEV